ncbi:MAG: hypothetical protein HY661_04900 [Betaproteobacteria bacterium]|nr:hypothetical protein [Betaproteobacteria bacterium]
MMKSKLAAVLLASAALTTHAGVATASPGDPNLSSFRVTQSAEDDTMGKSDDTMMRGPGSPWYDGAP